MRKLIFAGTPEFSVPCLEAALSSGCEVVAVYTQPDRPSGRGRALSTSPVKQRAVQAGVPVFQPESLRTTSARKQLQALGADLMIVVAYGLILTPQVLVSPKLGCWNVHASILPRWRGAAPIQRALLAGDTQTGVDLMQMERGLDTGPVILSLRTPVHATDTGASLHDRLAQLGAQLLVDALQRLAAGTLPRPRPQSDIGVTYAHKIEKREAILDFSEPSTLLERKVRAFWPWPVAETVLMGERVRVHSAVANEASHPASVPGSIVGADRAGIDIACGQGVLRITCLQREGGKPIKASEYLNARPDLRCP